MLRAYQGYHPRQFVRVMVPAILFWLPAFLMPETFPQKIFLSDSPALSLSGAMTGLPAPTLALMAFFFWLITGYLLVALNHRYLFLKTRSLLPLFFFLTLTSPVVGLSEINNFTLTIPVFVIILHIIFRTYRNNRLDLTFYSAAFWIGMASLLSLKSSFFMIVIWISLLSLRPFYPREWLVSLFGFLTPWALYFGIFYLIGHDPENLLGNILPAFLSTHPGRSLSTMQFIFLIYLGVLTIAGTVFLFLSLPAMKTRSRKFHMIFFWSAVLALFLMFRFRSGWLSFFTFLAIPLSYLYAFYFAAEKSSLVKRILFDLYFAGIIALIVAGMAG